MNNIFARFKNRGRITIGDKSVKVKKITIAQWKELFSVVDSLPSLIIDVVTSPKEERTAYLVVAAHHSLDDLAEVISVLTGLDRDYIVNNAALDEILEYFTMMAKVNNFEEIAKNIKSVLDLSMKNLTGESAIPQNQERQ